VKEKESFYELILSRRSIRQFKPEPISQDILKQLVNAARLAPSAANLQPLEFVVAEKEEITKKIFPCLKWAAYIAPEGNPKPGHEPMAYIIVLVNTTIRDKVFEYDVGAAIENMILAAWERGIGTCWLLSVEREKIQEILKIPAEYRIDSVLALGYPDEEPVVEDAKDSVKYWKDSNGQLHVPKRKLDDIIHFNKF
jgi:nitroreductase